MLDIVQLVIDQRSSLIETLGIMQEKCPEIRVPDESSPHWTHSVCVRFAGFDKLQTKRFVEILNLDYFSQPKNSIRILSFKDERILEACTPPAARYCRMRQARRLENEQLFLQDQWFCTEPISHEQNESYTSCGVTGDLLLTRFWLHGQVFHNCLIQNYILARYNALLCYATLTRDIRGHPDTSFLKLATGTVLA